MLNGFGPNLCGFPGIAAAMLGGSLLSMVSTSLQGCAARQPLPQAQSETKPPTSAEPAGLPCLQGGDSDQLDNGLFDFLHQTGAGFEYMGGSGMQARPQPWRLLIVRMTLDGGDAIIKTPDSMYMLAPDPRDPFALTFGSIPSTFEFQELKDGKFRVLLIKKQGQCLNAGPAHASATVAAVKFGPCNATNSYWRLCRVKDKKQDHAD